MFGESPPPEMTNPTNRVEITTSVQRRRRWTASKKVRMVEETLEPGIRR
jgi:transposase